MNDWIPLAMHEWNKSRLSSSLVSKPRIKRDHIDGPMLVMGDGRIHWLTLWERVLLRLGRINAATGAELTQRDKSLQFCPHCGAGIGKHRREGEGTCPDCPIETQYKERHEKN